MSDPFESAHLQISGYILDGAKNFTKYKNGADTNYGLLPDINNEAFVDCRFVSLAKMAAINPLFRGATVMLLLNNSIGSDGTGIAIGILNGNIVLDCHIEKEDSNLRLEEFANLCERSSRSFRLWGDFPGIDHKYDEAYTFPRLVENKSDLKKSYIQPLRNNRVILIVVACISALILISFANFAWDWYVQKQKDVIESLRLAQLSPDAQYLKMINAFSASKQYISADTTKQLKNQISAIPYSFHGWKLKNISCELPTCTFVWGNAGGTYQDFRDSAPKEWVNISPAIGTSLIGDLKTITHTYQLNLDQQDLPARSEWPTELEFAWSVGGSWQKLSSLGWSGDLKPPELREIPVGVSSAAVRNNPQAIWGIPWSVNNQPLWLVDGLSQLDRNVTLQKFDVSIDEKTGAALFNSAGIAYVKK